VSEGLMRMGQREDFPDDESTGVLALARHLYSNDSIQFIFRENKLDIGPMFI
jgi:hypothetical protein